MSTECVFGVLCQPARSWWSLTGRCGSYISDHPSMNHSRRSYRFQVDDCVVSEADTKENMAWRLTPMPKPFEQWREAVLKEKKSLHREISTECKRRSRKSFRCKYTQENGKSQTCTYSFKTQSLSGGKPPAYVVRWSQATLPFGLRNGKPQSSSLAYPLTQGEQFTTDSA